MFLKISFVTFPYLRIFLTYVLITFSKDVRLSWPQNVFSYRAYSPLYRISLLTYYFFRWVSGWVDLNNFLLVDFRSGFWHWKWLPEGVTHSSISQNCVSVSRLIDLGFGIEPRKWLPVGVTHSCTSHIFFLITRLLQLRSKFWPRQFIPRGHPLEF